MLALLERSFYHLKVPQSAEKRTAIYARSSTNVRTTESQLEACRRTAERLGLDVIHEFIDEGISGTIPTDSRPGTLELRTNLGALDVLLVYRLDRLSRSAVELGDLLRSWTHRQLRSGRSRIFRFLRVS